jgi:ribosome maturation factor RimP
MVELIGKTVEVLTVETRYAGKLVEINENEIHLETESGWLVIPLDRVASVKERERD